MNLLKLANLVLALIGAVLAIVTAVVAILYTANLRLAPELAAELPRLLRFGLSFAAFAVVAGLAAWAQHRVHPWRWVFQLALPAVGVVCALVLWSLATK